MGWNCIGDLLLGEGNANLICSRDTLREAFRLDVIEDPGVWMHMIQDRNISSSSYNQPTADQLAVNITERDLSCF